MYESELSKVESTKKATTNEAQKAAIAEAVAEAKVRHTASLYNVHVRDALTQLTGYE